MAVAHNLAAGQVLVANPQARTFESAPACRWAPTPWPAAARSPPLASLPSHLPPSSALPLTVSARSPSRHPQAWTSRNPFTRKVKDLGRFGLKGPIVGDELSADMRAQLLPTLLLLHSSPTDGSRALLMERRTGALMGDVSQEDYGCVAICPLWLGGVAKQSALYVVHNVEGLEGATAVGGDGLFLGGWEAARPKVADYSLSDSRFKFWLGATEWEPGQLERELADGAWLALEAEPALVIRDRVLDVRPGRSKPVWKELVEQLGPEGQPLLAAIYGDAK